MHLVGFYYKDIRIVYDIGILLWQHVSIFLSTICRPTYIGERYICTLVWRWSKGRPKHVATGRLSISYTILVFLTEYIVCFIVSVGRDGSVGIAAGYGAKRSGDRIPVGARFSAPVQTGRGAHPASCTMGTGSFPGVKSGRGVTLTPHPLLQPWSWKSRAIPLLLWAVRPVQSLSACTRVHFTPSPLLWVWKHNGMY